MKRYILIRDDDINYYSNTRLLELLYRPLFDRGLPVNFSVIPEVMCNTPIALGSQSGFARKFGLRYEPFIPPTCRGRNEQRAVSANRGLVSFIREHPIEVLQHGLNHQWNGDAEFAAHDEAKLDSRLQKGRDILEEAFGTRPAFFCPPWDRISREGLQALNRAGYLGVSAAYFGRNLPLAAWPTWAWNRYRAKQQFLSWRNFLFVQHPGYLLSLFRPASEVMRLFIEAYERSRVLVLVNHYWEYNFDGKIAPDRERLDIWFAVLDYILRRPEAQVVTFRTLYDEIVRERGQSPSEKVTVPESAFAAANHESRITNHA